jgi:hypothetical protein
MLSSYNKKTTQASQEEQKHKGKKLRNASKGRLENKTSEQKLNSFLALKYGINDNDALLLLMNEEKKKNKELETKHRGIFFILITEK